MSSLLIITVRDPEPPCRYRHNLTCEARQNFAMSIADAQMNVSGEQSPAQLELNRLDLFLVIAFTVELVLNAFANWLYDFVSNGWNIFDVIVVTLSLVGLAPTGLPVRLVLLLRCSRALRIFGKLKSVAKIFSALSYSLLSMANAFFIIFVITAICESLTSRPACLDRSCCACLAPPSPPHPFIYDHCCPMGVSS